MGKTLTIAGIALGAVYLAHIGMQGIVEALLLDMDMMGQHMERIGQ